MEDPRYGGGVVQYHIERRHKIENEHRGHDSARHLPDPDDTPQDHNPHHNHADDTGHPALHGPVRLEQA